jgi:hypothetical protein
MDRVLNWWDRQFINTRFSHLVIAAMILSLPVMAFALLGAFFCHDAQARSRAIGILAVSGVLCLVLLVNLAAPR